MDPLTSSPLEDGSTAYFDASGNLTQIVQRDGSTYQADSTIWSDFAKNVTGTVGDAIRSAFARPTAAPQAPAAPAATAAASSQRTLLLLGGFVLGVILLKKFA